MTGTQSPAMGPVEYKEEGNRLFKEGKWKEAIEEYTKGLDAGGKKELPEDVHGMLLSNRSQCRLNLEEWEIALEDANAALKLLPSYTKLLFRRATANEKLGKNFDALADYAIVARAEPKNTVAVQATRRLRDDVQASSQKQRDEVLPATLLEVIGKADSTADAKVEACGKLRGLCIHRSLGASILQAGALDVLARLAHSDNTDIKVRAAVLGVLSVMASGHEKQEDDDGVKSPSPPPNANQPLEAPKSALELRKKLKEKLDLEKLRDVCHIDESAMRYLSLIIGHTYEPEDKQALEILNEAMLFPEDTDINVPKAGLLGLSTVYDTRRRLGKNAIAVMPSAVLLKCIETALGTTGCQDLLHSMLATVFALLADKDRSKADEIDVAEVGLKILEPFLSSGDTNHKSNGLAGLATFFAASAEAGTSLLQASTVPLATILSTLSRPPAGPEGRAAQGHAAECLLLTTGNVKTRQHFIDGGGIEMLLNALRDGHEGSSGMIRAKLIGVLSMLAAHSKEIREEIFEFLDFLMELRHALDVVKESLEAARKGSPGAPAMDETRRLARGLYESCACLTIHGEFKESLKASKKTLRSMHELVTAADLVEDPNLAFMYATIMFNLCRSRADKQRPKKDQFPFNELGEDDLQALEEFYDKMPAESRPVKNGDVDSGSPELAEDLRSWCVLNCGGSSSVISNLGKCTAGGSIRVCNLAALTMRFLCSQKDHRRNVVAGGGVRMLLALIDLEDETARDAARQALAQVCITTNPQMLNYRDQLDVVRPLVSMLGHNHELMKFEAAMGLTNLLGCSEEVRTRAVQADGWNACRDLLFEENEMVQRAGIEAMCNFTMASEILERFAEGKCELEIKIFCAFCLSEDQATQLAASGALAMLAAYEEISPHIASNEKFHNLLQAVKEATDSNLQHRIVSCLSAICQAPNTPAEVIVDIRAALREGHRKGFKSKEAQDLASSALAEGNMGISAIQE